MGCIPVMLREVLNGVPMSQPLDERLNWHAFAVLVSMDELARLHEILEAISPARRARMRRVLAKLWPRFLWTSVYGPYLGEDGKEDAFETTMQVLRRRVALMPPLPRTAFGE